MLTEDMMPKVRMMWGEGDDRVEFAFGHLTVYCKNGNGPWRTVSVRVFTAFIRGMGPTEQPQIVHVDFKQ